MKAGVRLAGTPWPRTSWAEGGLLGGWTKTVYTRRFEATGLRQLAGTLPLAGWDDHILGLPWPFEYRLE